MEALMRDSSAASFLRNEKNFAKMRGTLHEGMRFGRLCERKNVMTLRADPALCYERPDFGLEYSCYPGLVVRRPRAQGRARINNAL
jgi:hypothetical protein